MNSSIPAGIPRKEKSYDHIFKEILETFPSHLVITFLNSVFKHNIPPDSTVEPLRTESNFGNRTIADYILKVTEPSGIPHYFHVEAQTANDKNMAFRMLEYGVRFALDRAKDHADMSDILIEFPNAVVFYLKDNKNTPQSLTVTIKAPDGQELRYTIQTERISDYTPEELLNQGKFPLFPFYMANFTGKEPEKFEREWLAGCAKLNEFVKIGRIGRAEADKLIDGSNIVIRKANYPNAEEVFKKMDTMFDIIGVGVDWYEIERQKKEYAAQVAAQVAEKAAAEKAAAEKAAAEKVAAAQAAAEKAAAQAAKRAAERAAAQAALTAKKAIAKGLSPEDAADLANLSVNEVLALISN